MMNFPQLESLLKKIPKTDLHCHLDGSLRLPTLIDLARSNGMQLPSETVEGLGELVFKDHYADLEEYLKTFAYATAVMQTPDSLERIAFELVEDAQQEGVRYMEVRFAPQLHINRTMDMETVLSAVHLGLKRAEEQFNLRDAVVRNREPAFHFGIIVCALRSFGPFSHYYKHFIESHQFSDPRTIFPMASLELAKGAVQVRDKLGIPIVGFDLAGAEAGNPARDHGDAFQYAHEHFLKKTVHAGEAYGAPSIFQAITELHADRIGHGYYLFDEDRIDSPHIQDKKKFIHDLAHSIADRRITIEVCLTSNMQTNPSIRRLENHSMKQMLGLGMSVSLCTDNRTVSKTTVSNEILKALDAFDIDPYLLKSMMVYGLKRSFYPGAYLEKRKYVRQCIDYYDDVVRGTPLEIQTQPEIKK